MNQKPGPDSDNFFFTLALCSLVGVALWALVAYAMGVL